LLASVWNFDIGIRKQCLQIYTQFSQHHICITI